MIDASVERLQRQLLAGPAGSDTVSVCRRLLAIQAQDPQGARLAVRARTAGLTAADVDRALTEDRSVVVGWFNRGTLHMVPSDDHRWLLAVTAPPRVKPTLKRLARAGLGADAADRAVTIVARSLDEGGPMSREALREELEGSGVALRGGALADLLGLACLRGLAVRGPVADGRHLFVSVDRWLGPIAAPVDRGAALAELARRYLNGHGPADERDLARWAGITLRDARAGLAAIAAELHQRADGLVELAAASGTASRASAAPKLLGSFDPLLLGWRDRTPVTGGRTDFSAGSVLRPFALVNGRTVGFWRIREGRIEVDLDTGVAAEDTAALADEETDIERFLGLVARLATRASASNRADG